MPFGAYEASPQQAFATASRIMAETGCAAVKLEGGQVMAETIAFLTARGIPVMAHVGVLSRDRGIDVISAAADHDAFPADWRIEMVGSIDAATDTARLRDAEATGRVRHHGVVGPMEARDLLLDARIGVVPFRRTPVTDQIFPTKLFEYLAAGLAVIATDVPLWRRLLDGVSCVTFVPADDPGAIAAAVRRYAEDPELLAAHGAEARRAAARFSWSREADRLVAMYDELLDSPRKG